MKNSLTKIANAPCSQRFGGGECKLGRNCATNGAKPSGLFFYSQAGWVKQPE